MTSIHVLVMRKIYFYTCLHLHFLTLLPLRLDNIFPLLIVHAASMYDVTTVIKFPSVILPMNLQYQGFMFVHTYDV